MSEFKKGDLVTFNAFQSEEIPARVVDVLSVDSTGLIRYQLEGAEKAKPLTSFTTGRSIKQSAYFVEPGEFVW